MYQLNERGAFTSPDATPTKASELEVARQILDKEIEELVAVAAALSSRLQPVLRSEPSGNDQSEANVTPPHSAVVAHINQMAARITFVRKGLVSVIQRLEV